MTNETPHTIRPRHAIAELQRLAAHALPPVEHLVDAHVSIAMSHLSHGPSALSPATASVGLGASRGRAISRSRLVAVVSTLLVLATGSLASANELPAPVQDAIANVAQVVGIAVPHAHRHVGGGQSSARRDGARDGTEGKSALVRKDSTIGKGAATSAAARERRLAHAAEVAAAQQQRADHRKARKDSRAAARATRRRDAAQRAAHPPRSSTHLPSGNVNGSHVVSGSHSTTTGSTTGATSGSHSGGDTASANPVHGGKR